MVDGVGDADRRVLMLMLLTEGGAADLSGHDCSSTCEGGKVEACGEGATAVAAVVVVGGVSGTGGRGWKADEHAPLLLLPVVSSD